MWGAEPFGRIHHRADLLKRVHLIETVNKVSKGVALRVARLTSLIRCGLALCHPSHPDTTYAHGCRSDPGGAAGTSFSTFPISARVLSSEGDVQRRVIGRSCVATKARLTGCTASVEPTQAVDSTNDAARSESGAAGSKSNNRRSRNARLSQVAPILTPEPAHSLPKTPTCFCSRP